MTTFNLQLPYEHWKLLNAICEKHTPNYTADDNNLLPHLMILFAIRALYRQMHPEGHKYDTMLLDVSAWERAAIETEYEMIEVNPSKPAEPPQPAHHASSKAIDGNT